ncbi:MAG: HDOD domain-containing protein [Steroidobacteraceae bacterium]
MSMSPTSSAPGTLAFTFVSELARELSEGKVELPGFPQVFAQVCRSIDDPEITAQRMAAIVGAEPGLAARLLAAANSAAFNPGHQPVGNLPGAIVRLGAANVRSTTAAFAVAQLRLSSALQPVERDLQELWERSTHVAAICYVVASASHLDPDEAFLAGLLHGIGELYVLARLAQRADLLAGGGEVQAILDSWHAPIGKSLLENWCFPPHIVEAVEEQDDAARRPHAQADVADALVCAKALQASAGDAQRIQALVATNRAFRQLKLDAPRCSAILVEAAGEISALRSALGAPAHGQ